MLVVAGQTAGRQNGAAVKKSDRMVGHIGSWPVFLDLGVGSELVAIVALVAFFKRRRWF
ncbi:MAG TPA: hypothetical protein VHP82_01745 [Gaiellaceae bacterium]|nr:hypothetical protein [Gaiellaceae bacterium]